MRGELDGARWILGAGSYVDMGPTRESILRMAEAARRFELIAGTSKKFWQIAVKGRAFTVRYGRIGSDGVEKTTTCASPSAAALAAVKLVREKMAKGYKEVGSASPKAAPKKSATDAKKSATGDVFAQLSALWAVKRPELEGTLRKGATRAQLAAFDEKLGLPLPKTFYAMYAWHDGAEDENEWFEAAYGFMRLEFILMQKKVFDDVRGDDGTWDRAWVPFLQNNGSDVVCIDTKTGQIFEWFNYGRNGARVFLARTLDAWLAAHVAITAAGNSLADDDAVYTVFTGAAAKKIRAKISPGYPNGRRE